MILSGMLVWLSLSLSLALAPALARSASYISTTSSTSTNPNAVGSTKITGPLAYTKESDPTLYDHPVSTLNVPGR
jgi:hypothetical protein